MKKLIPVFLVSASLLGGLDVAYAAKASNPEVWADSQAKEWGDTPDSVKYVLSNVQISRSQGANGNKKQTDLFSTKWLKEMQRSPSTYRLSSQDQKWVDNVLANAEAKNSGSWKPSNKTPKAPAKRQVEQKAVTETASAPVIPKASKQNKNVFSDDNVVAVKEKAVSTPKKAVVDKEVSKPVKAESKALPKPVIVAKEKPDLTPVKPKETVKVMSAEDERAAKESLAEKARLNEQDAFVATLPVIADSDMERNPIDEVKEEVLDMRNQAMEARIQELDEQEAAKEEERAESEAQAKSEPNVAVIKEDGVKQIIPLNDPVEAIKQDMPANVELTHVEPALKENDVLPIDNDKASQVSSEVVSNDTGWISSALVSLGSISVVMFLIVLTWIRRVVSNGTANKYF